jgi:hypothetical protein
VVYFVIISYTSIVVRGLALKAKFWIRREFDYTVGAAGHALSRRD